MSGDAYVTVRFRLERDDDGWPPASSEDLWAVPVGDGFRLANAPWFARGYAEGDVVSAVPDDEGVLWVRGATEWSGNSTVRLIVLPEGPLAGDLAAALDVFEPVGVTGEGLGQYGVVALTVPPDADPRAVKELLRRGKSDGWWAYEVGCVDDGWVSA